VVVAIHGGSWESTYGKIIMRGVSAELCRRGWAVWNIEYRRLGRGGGWPTSFEDVAAAVDHLAVLDAPIDLGRVAGLGHSAGGQLVLWAAGRYKLAAGAPGAGPRVRLAAAVAQAGVLDMTGAHAVAPDGSVGMLMGGSPADVPERYDIGDPIRMVPLDLPVLVLHGSEDRTVSVERSRAYAAAAQHAGADVELVEIAGDDGRHRSHLDPDGAAFAAAAAWLDRRLPGPSTAPAPPVHSPPASPPGDRPWAGRRP
jgi:acetyl esterase/lipase